MAATAGCSLLPNRRTLIVDLRTVPAGQTRQFRCGEVPFGVHRLAASQLPAHADAGTRSLEGMEWIVFETRCTHLGCELQERAGGGWLCLCHGSQFDARGRVTQGPATRDLDVPRHEFMDSNTLRIDCD